MGSDPAQEGLTYKGAGVDTLGADEGIRTLATWINATFGFNPSRPLLPLGYYANVLPVSADLAIATRVLMIVAFVFLTAPISAQMIGRAGYYVGIPLWKGTSFDELRGHNGRQASAPEDQPKHA